MLFNSAGFELVGPVEETPIAVAREQFDTNFFGLVRLTQLALPGMRAQRYGRIVNVSSVFGRLHDLEEDVLESFEETRRGPAVHRAVACGY